MEIIEQAVDTINILLPKHMSSLKFLKAKKNRTIYKNSLPRHKKNCKAQMKIYIEWIIKSFLKPFFKKYGFVLANIGLELEDANEALEIPVNIDIKCETNLEIHSKNKQDLLFYKYKEAVNLSDHKFNELRKCSPAVPLISFAHKCKKKLNNLFQIHTNTSGSFFDPKEKIEFFLNIFHNDMVINDNTIHIRLSGDGTQIAKNLSVLNFTFHT